MTALRGLLLCVVVALLALAGGARAAMLIVDPSTGLLTGADLIELRGLTSARYGTYAVEFRVGTCIQRFDGCDSAEEDFAFTAEADALIAAQALLDQVLLDGPAGSFDSDFSQTRGCRTSGPPPYCRATVPWDRRTISGGSSVAHIVDYTYAQNTNDITSTQEAAVASGSQIGWNTRVDATGGIWAVYTFVPEPATLLLFGLGAAGALYAGHRRRPRATTAA
tara:strand:+ start:564 stop:1229 length:666 start_codon:yes stop_codon:yes gene_type:complete